MKVIKIASEQGKEANDLLHDLNVLSSFTVIRGNEYHIDDTREVEFDTDGFSFENVKAILDEYEIEYSVLDEEQSEYVEQANKFLNETRTTLTIEYIRHGSMDWDKDGQTRNIFDCVLKNHRGEMKVTFGASVADSCKKLSILEMDREVEIGSGFSFDKMGFSFFYKFKTTTEQLRKVKSGEIDAITLVNMDAVKVEYDKVADAYVQETKKMKYNVSRFERKVLDYHFERLAGIFSKRIQNKAIELSNMLDYAALPQDTIQYPNAYDILTCITKNDPETFEDFCSNFGYDEDSRTAERTYHAVVAEWAGVSKLWSEEEITNLQEIQ